MTTSARTHARRALGAAVATLTLALALAVPSAVAAAPTVQAAPTVAAATTAAPTVAATPVATGPVRTANLAAFNPGYIISDANFYRSSSMSASAIQQFLDTKGSRCVPGADGTVCLKDFRQTTWTRPADAQCAGAYVGAENERASDIIAKVSAACGINPQVILVMLQKEQSLVTASGSGLYANRYRSAMGYGCPDTAACDAQYYGFFNQVYSAAHQLRNYALNPTRYSHRAGMTNAVRYHPNLACGSSAVYIHNQATASLYNYTPYQPNAAALAAGYGVGDACSSYGNRNFWNYFSDWFYNPTGVPPTGFLDSVTVSSLTVTATGWAMDPDTSDPISVHVYVDGASAAFTADGSRPDVGAAFGNGDAHGFSATMTTTAGTHEVCVWALNSDVGSGNTLLGCRTVVVPQPLRGFLDSVEPDATGAWVNGWTFDPDALGTPVAVTVTVDGVATEVLADAPRPDLAAAFGIDPQHGIRAHVPAAPGQHQVCVSARTTALGKTLALGCRTVTVVNRPPNGFLDSVTSTATSVTAKGWAFDRDTDGPVAVHMYVDGSAAAFTADASRPDVGAFFGIGSDHGYVATMPTTPGRHSVCLYVINTPSGPNLSLGCRTVTVTERAPIGFLDSVTTTSTTITATGWAIDPDTDAPIAVHTYVDGNAVASTAGAPRPDLVGFGRGTDHGYSTTVPATPGSHRVCVWAINANPGGNTLLGCRDVVVRNAAPMGFLDTLTVTGTSVTATGWALDPDTTAAIPVHMYVDGASAGFTADAPRPDVGAAFRLGDNHGFTATMTTSPGAHRVCLYAIDPAGGTNTQFACRDVNVG